MLGTCRVGGALTGAADIRCGADCRCGAEWSARATFADCIVGLVSAYPFVFGAMPRWRSMAGKKSSSFHVRPSRVAFMVAKLISTCRSGHWDPCTADARLTTSPLQLVASQAVAAVMLAAAVAAAA